MIRTHLLSVDAFAELASGAGSAAVVGQLGEAQLSKHLMLLHVVAEAAWAEPPSASASAFAAGFQLLTRVQRATPETVSWLLSLPHIGSWAHDCLARLDLQTSPDFGYLAGAAAGAALQASVQFDLDVPVRDGRVLLPGLGCLQVPGTGDGWVRLSSDGERLRIGSVADVACAALVPDDGSGTTEPHWQGTLLARAEADGQAWEVLLETADDHLDRYTLPMVTSLTRAEAATWRQRIQSAWELLVRQHQWAAGSIAAGVSVIVPLVPRSDLDSAVSPAAFGAIATSAPPSAVSLAETLIHEFQHIKLSGVMDMLPLIVPGGEPGYAPWREDPRPMGGILQGVYAFAGIVRFWDIQRGLETDPDEKLRASVLYERWRLAVEAAIATLTASGSLTPTGVRFVTMLGARAHPGQSAPVTAEAAAIAREISLDNRLTWQLRHATVRAEVVASLASAYQRGAPSRDQDLPPCRVESEIRKVDGIARSRLLALRGQEPRRFRMLTEADQAGLAPADALLIGGDAAAAAAAHRKRLAAESDPAAWIGLSLAVHRLPLVPGTAALAELLPLLLETHAFLAERGIAADPLELAAWFE